MEKTPKAIVLHFIESLNKENFDSAKNCLNDDMMFEGVLGKRDGAESYMKDMEQMKLKYDIKQAFAEGEDVCLLYNITMSGKTIFSCGWYQISNEKISLIKVVFDPRPLFDVVVKK